MRIYLYIEPEAITDRNTSPTTAAGVVDIIKQVWYHVVIVVAVRCAFHIHFFGHFYQSQFYTYLFSSVELRPENRFFCSSIT